MNSKIVSFGNLYSHDFTFEIVAARKRQWPENNYIDFFWNKDRTRNGILMLHGCNGVLRLKNGEFINIKKDEIIYIPCGMRYRLRLIECEKPCYVYIIDYRMRDADGEVIKCSDNIIKLPPNLIGSYISNFNRIYDNMYHTPVFYSKRYAALYSFISDVILACRNDSHDGIRFMNIAKAVTYMEQNYIMPLSNKYLADMCSVSQDCFIRTFKKFYDTTPKKYILNLKINRAKEMLDDNQKTVSEISYDLGFESPTYFSNLFKKKVGVTPSQYRNHIV